MEFLRKHLKFYHGVLLLAGGAFCVYFWSIDSTPLLREEDWSVMVALANLFGHPHYVIGRVIEAGGFFIPIWRMEHVGSVMEYLMFPILWLGGVHTHVIRFGEIFYLILAAVLAAVAVRRLAGVRSGLIALFLILFHSGLYYWGLHGFVGEVPQLHLCVVLSVLLFVRWVQTPSVLTAILWGFMVGVGMYTKMHLLWQCLGYGIFWIVVLARHKFLGAWKHFLCYLAGFFLSPVAIINYLSGGAEIKETMAAWGARHSMSRLHVPQEMIPHSAWDYLSYRIQVVGRFMLGWETPPVILGILMLLPFGVLLWWFFKKKDEPVRRQVCLTWFLIVVIHTVGVYTPVHISEETFLVILPLLLMCVAVAMDSMFKRSWVIVLLLGLAWFEHGRQIEKGINWGDIRHHTSEEPAEFMLCRGIHSPITVTLPESLSLAVVTRHRICPRSYWDSRGKNRRRFYEEAMENRNNWYVYAYEDDFAPQEEIVWFEKFEAQKNLREKNVRVFNLGPRDYVKLFQLEPKT
ncbi:MAG TPA: hypothetical protein PK876_00730 [Elusimicrobiota bacterium]|nr:hypothetical protein [Elusimicrobiota bacterium]